MEPISLRNELHMKKALKRRKAQRALASSVSRKGRKKSVKRGRRKAGRLIRTKTGRVRYLPK